MAKANKTPREPREDTDYRESRRLRQSEKIRSAAARLFRQKTYLGTTINDIAEAADVNKAMIYYYFKNKEDILFEVLSRMNQEIWERALPIAQSDSLPEEKLKALVMNHVTWQMSQIDILLVGDREKIHLSPRAMLDYIHMRDRYELIFQEVITDGAAQGAFRSIDPKLGSMFILGFLNSMIHWFKVGGKFTADEIASEACTCVSGMLSKDKT